MTSRFASFAIAAAAAGLAAFGFAVVESAAQDGIWGGPPLGFPGRDADSLQEPSSA